MAAVDGGVSLTAKLLPTQQWKMILYRYYKILVLQLLLQRWDQDSLLLHFMDGCTNIISRLLVKILRI